MSAAIAAVLLLAGAMPAVAHGAASSEAAFNFDGLAFLLLVALAAFYGAGVLRLWRSAGWRRGIRAWHVAAFGAGWATLLIAVVSSLHDLAAYSFTAHMVEHELLMAVAAPLIALSSPAVAFLWSVPLVVRRWLGGLWHVRVIALPGRILRDPLAATILHGLAIWAWHAPVLFDAANANEAVHWLQHASFFLTALLFWSVLVSAATQRSEGGAVGHLFATSMHMGVLGALMTLSPVAWYLPAAAPAGGLTPLEDQQLAGLIMWIPAGAIYGGAALAFAGLWIARSSTQRGRDAVG
jgi:cytochrome c oxidase assembly factor CtaG